MENDAEYLRLILEAMGLKPDMAGFEILAQDLSRLAHKTPAWSAKYVHSVYHRQIEVSPRISRAIEALAQTIDGTPVGVAGAQVIRVLANPAEIPEGVLIPAGAKVLKCATPGCPVKFIRTSPGQTHHDLECTRRHQQLKREQSRRR